MESLFMDICMDLWSGDVAITLKGFIKEIEQRIENLESHIGPDAHKREAEMGIEDLTGMTIEEQDAQIREQIAEYEALKAYLENDSNWTP